MTENKKSSLNEVTEYAIEPLYTKPSGLYVQEIDRQDLPLGFIPIVRHLVTIPPKGYSANHKHPRNEAFIGIGSELTFMWIDCSGNKQSIDMNKDGRLKLIVVPSNTPHVIINNSSSPAVLLEYADKVQIDDDITLVDVLSA